MENDFKNVKQWAHWNGEALKEKRKGRKLAMGELILPIPEDEGGPTIHRAQGRNWVNGSLFPPGTVTSGKESSSLRAANPCHI